MDRTWSLPEADNKLTEIVNEALKSGPQIITWRGEATAVILSYEAYRKLTLERQPLSEFFRDSPLADLDLDLTRDKSHLRDIGDL